MTTATIPAGPIFPATEVVVTSNTPALGSTFTILKSVKLALDGEKKNEGTKKLVKDWLKTNKKIIKDASMQEELDVSSWCLVLDIEFGEMASVRRNDDTTRTPQAVGSTGDKVAVLVNVDAGSYTQNALHVAQTVTRIDDTTTTLTDEQTQSVQASTRPLTVTVDYTVTTNTAAAGTWGAETVCGTKWAGACNGLSAPWGLHTLTEAVTVLGVTINGTLRAYKWLGDKGSTASKVMQVEKDDKLNILCYEFVDKVYDSVAGAWGTSTTRWAVSQYTVTGASSLVASAAALLAASQLF